MSESQSKTPTDYQIVVETWVPCRDNNTREGLAVAWGKALATLGIPFEPVLARFMAMFPGKPEEYQQLHYAVSGYVQPSAEAIRDAVVESLAIHGFGAPAVSVTVAIVVREVVDYAAQNHGGEQPKRKGVLAA